MKFGEAIKTVFKKYAVFEGVASRAEFWWFWLFTVIVIGGLWLVGGLFQLIAWGTLSSGAYDAGFGLLGFAGFIFSVAGLAYLGLVIPHIALLVRRFRDTGRPFWYYFLILVPLAGAITILVMCLQPSKGAVQGAPAAPAAQA